MSSTFGVIGARRIRCTWHRFSRTFAKCLYPRPDHGSGDAVIRTSLLRLELARYSLRGPVTVFGAFYRVENHATATGGAGRLRSSRSGRARRRACRRRVAPDGRDSGQPPARRGPQPRRFHEPAHRGAQRIPFRGPRASSGCAGFADGAVAPSLARHAAITRPCGPRPGTQHRAQLRADRRRHIGRGGSHRRSILRDQ